MIKGNEYIVNILGVTTLSGLVRTNEAVLDLCKIFQTSLINFALALSGICMKNITTV